MNIIPEEIRREGERLEAERLAREEDQQLRQAMEESAAERLQERRQANRGRLNAARQTFRTFITEEGEFVNANSGRRVRHPNPAAINALVNSELIQKPEADRRRRGVRNENWFPGEEAEGAVPVLIASYTDALRGVRAANQQAREALVEGAEWQGQLGDIPNRPEPLPGSGLVWDFNRALEEERQVEGQLQPQKRIIGYVYKLVKEADFDVPPELEVAFNGEAQRVALQAEPFERLLTVASQISQSPVYSRTEEGYQQALADLRGVIERNRHGVVGQQAQVLLDVLEARHGELRTINQYSNEEMSSYVSGLLGRENSPPLINLWEPLREKLRPGQERNATRREKLTEAFRNLQRRGVDRVYQERARAAREAEEAARAAATAAVRAAEEAARAEREAQAAAAKAAKKAKNDEEAATREMQAREAANRAREAQRVAEEARVRNEEATRRLREETEAANRAREAERVTEEARVRNEEAAQEAVPARAGAAGGAAAQAIPGMKGIMNAKVAKNRTRTVYNSKIPRVIQDRHKWFRENWLEQIGPYLRQLGFTGDKIQAEFELVLKSEKVVEIFRRFKEYLEGHKPDNYGIIQITDFLWEVIDIYKNDAKRMVEERARGSGAVGGEPAAVGGEPAAVGGEPAAVGGEPAAAMGEPAAVLPPPQPMPAPPEAVAGTGEAAVAAPVSREHYIAEQVRRIKGAVETFKQGLERVVNPMLRERGKSQEQIDEALKKLLETKVVPKVKPIRDRAREIMDPSYGIPEIQAELTQIFKEVKESVKSKSATASGKKGGRRTLGHRKGRKQTRRRKTRKQSTK